MTQLSVQLYSLRNAGPLSHQLDLVLDAGLATVELTSSNFDNPGETRRLLGERGIASPSGHVGIERLQGSFNDTVRAADELGLKLLVLWGLPEDKQPTDRDGWERAGRDLGKIAGRLAERGLRFAFHNHDWELAQLPDGSVALDVLFAAARGTPLEWQADLAWLARGGADPRFWFEKPGLTLRSVHVKDLAPAGEAADEDGWADLGTGRLEWKAWWPILQRRGVELFVLEHDEPSNAARFLARSASAARRLGEDSAGA